MIDIGKSFIVRIIVLIIFIIFIIFIIREDRHRGSDRERGRERGNRGEC